MPWHLAGRAYRPNNFDSAELYQQLHGKWLNFGPLVDTRAAAIRAMRQMEAIDPEWEWKVVFVESEPPERMFDMFSQSVSGLSESCGV